MINMPKVKIAVVGVSRDCFPAELTKKRLGILKEELKNLNIDFYMSEVIIESEIDMLKALEDVKAAGANAACIYLGNFGPEAPETIFAQKFNGPTMFCAAAEETKNDLFGGRGDAYCGMLNASYNLALRKVKAHIPKMPVGSASECANMIKEFVSIAKVYIGVKSLKVFSFGPRPENFFACNAPIKPLYDLGIEIMENSELDLFEMFNKIDENLTEVKIIENEMRAEIGDSSYSSILPKLARFEYALTKFYKENLGASSYGVFANKCWPSFQTSFGFVPCYVNSRMAAKGIPVSCEVDIYGAISEYICQLATDVPATLLDINNSVPCDMITDGMDLKGSSVEDLFMGFHCGNTSICNLKSSSLKYQLIMKRLLEPDSEPNISRGTIEGQIKPGDITFFRLHGTADAKLQAYVAEGEVLDLDPQSFGGIGVFAIPNMARFYRYILINKNYPHHGAVAFNKSGKILFDALALLGVEDVGYPLPKGVMYPGENPF